MENIDKNNDTNDIFELVKQLSNNFAKIVSRDELRKYKKLDWGDNGAGDRWANKKFNYTVIYSTGKYKTYSENDSDEIDKNLWSEAIYMLPNINFISYFEPYSSINLRSLLKPFLVWLRIIKSSA
jgi:hypothetical protein